MERLGNMQRKRLFLVFMISCICLLPIDAGAQATAVGKILKGTAKAAKSHSYGFSRAGIAAREFEKHNRLNRNHDSTYWDSLKRDPMFQRNLRRSLHIDSSVNWDSLFASRLDNQPYPNDSALYEDSLNDDDSVVMDLEYDFAKTAIDSTENVYKSSATTTSHYEDNDSIAWKLSLGLLILIVAIICCGLKLFCKKGKTK